MANENEMEGTTTENPGAASPFGEDAGPPDAPPELPTREKYDELEDNYLRLRAEYDNFRKRSQREKDEIYANATAGVLLRLLSVQDNFERARQYDCSSEEFAKGFEMIEKDFSGLLSSLGVEAFGQIGDPFDPKKHHAVMHIEDETLGENVISQVLQKGYMMGDKILRPAMVQTAN